jgi:hypothetical protein
MVMIVILFSLVTSSCIRSGGVITAEEAADAVRRFDQAWQAKNSNGLDSILAEQYFYFTQSGGVVDRNNLLATAASPDYVLENAAREQVSVILRGNTAVVNTTWRGKGIYFGRSFDDYQRCSVTLLKENGKVRILSEHCTLIQAPR